MKTIFLSFGIFSCLMSAAQPLRLHVMGGAANYYGDLQTKKVSFNQANVAVGAGATFDITDRVIVRGEYVFTQLGADDKRNTAPALRRRNLNFKTYIQELSIAGEFNLLNPETHKFNLYVFAGAAVFRFSPYTSDTLGRKIYLQGLGTEGQGLPQFPSRKIYSRTQFSIPLGGGVKYSLSSDIQLSVEYGLRYTTTDYLDDVSATYISRDVLLSGRGPLAVKMAFRGDELKPNPGTYPSPGTNRGSTKYNDFYYAGLAKLSFRMTWFDNQGGFGYGRKKNKFGCPSVR